MGMFSIYWHWKAQRAARKASEARETAWGDDILKPIIEREMLLATKGVSVVVGREHYEELVRAACTLRRVRDALATDETGDGLVEVARAAHQSELMVSFRK